MAKENKTPGRITKRFSLQITGLIMKHSHQDSVLDKQFERQEQKAQKQITHVMNAFCTINLSLQISEENVIFAINGAKTFGKGKIKLDL